MGDGAVGLASFPTGVLHCVKLEIQICHCRSIGKVYMSLVNRRITMKLACG